MWTLLPQAQQICYELTVAVKRDAQGFANVSKGVWYAQLSATAAGHATRIPNSNGM